MLLHFHQPLRLCNVIVIWSFSHRFKTQNNSSHVVKRGSILIETMQNNMVSLSRPKLEFPLSLRPCPLPFFLLTLELGNNEVQYCVQHHGSYKVAESRFKARQPDPPGFKLLATLLYCLSVSMWTGTAVAFIASHRRRPLLRNGREFFCIGKW